VSPLPVCQSAISLPQALQASQQSLMGHYGITIIDNRKNAREKNRENDFNIAITAYNTI